MRLDRERRDARSRDHRRARDSWPARSCSTSAAARCWRSASTPARARWPAAPTPLANDVGVAGGRALVAASSRLLLASAGHAARARAGVDRSTTARRGPAASERGDYWQVRVSPDDRAAAVTMLEPQLRTLDVYRAAAACRARVATGLTLALAADTDPVWSPDGRRVLFRSLQGGQPRLFSRVAGVARCGHRDRLPAAGDLVPTDWRGGASAAAMLVSWPHHDARRDTDLIAARARRRHGRARSRARASTSPTAAGRPTGGGWPTCRTSSDSPTCSSSAWPAGARVRVTVGWRPQAAMGRRTGRRSTSSAATRDRCGSTVSRCDRRRCRRPPTSRVCPGLRDFDVAHAGERLLAILPAPGARPWRRARARGLADAAAAMRGDSLAFRRPQ